MLETPMRGNPLVSRSFYAISLSMLVAEDNRKRYRHTGHYPLVLDHRPQEASTKDLSEALVEPSYVASSWAVFDY